MPLSDDNLKTAIAIVDADVVPIDAGLVVYGVINRPHRRDANRRHAAKACRRPPESNIRKRIDRHCWRRCRSDGRARRRRWTRKDCNCRKKRQYNTLFHFISGGAPFQSTSIKANESGISENIAEPSGCWINGTSVWVRMASVT